MSEIAEKVINDPVLASDSLTLAEEVEQALKQYAVVQHPKYGEVYAYEVDGFGNAYFMDDANIPSLLALPYLNAIDRDASLYQRTRKLVWSEDNPLFLQRQCR